MEEILFCDDEQGYPSWKGAGCGKRGLSATTTTSHSAAASFRLSSLPPTWYLVEFQQNSDGMLVCSRRTQVDITAMTTHPTSGSRTPASKDEANTGADFRTSLPSDNLVK